MTLSQTSQLVILLMCLASLHAAPIPEDNGADESNLVLTENEKKVLNLEKQKAELDMQELDVVQEEEGNDSKEDDNVHQIHEAEIAVEKEEDEALIEAIKMILEANRKGELKESDIVECNSI